MSKYVHFSARDFQKAMPRCYMSDMDGRLLEMLDAARTIADIPFVLNSAYRSKEYEIQAGRDGTSSHCKGLAVDIRAKTSRSRFLIIDALLKAGFTRIGVAKNYIHADIDPDKDEEVIWDYYE